MALTESEGYVNYRSLGIWGGELFPIICLVEKALFGLNPQYNCYQDTASVKEIRNRKQNNIAYPKTPIPLIANL